MIALSRHILLLFLFSKHYLARKPSITCQGLIQFDGILTCLLTIKNVLFEKNSNHIMKSRNLDQVDPPQDSQSSFLINHSSR